MKLFGREIGWKRKATEGEVRPGPYLLSDGWLSATAGRLMNWWQAGYSLQAILSGLRGVYGTIEFQGIFKIDGRQLFENTGAERLFVDSADYRIRTGLAA